MNFGEVYALVVEAAYQTRPGHSGQSGLSNPCSSNSQINILRMAEHKPETWLSCRDHRRNGMKIISLVFDIPMHASVTLSGWNACCSMYSANCVPIFANLQMGAVYFKYKGFRQ
jgi:hypothetical protein